MKQEHQKNTSFSLRRLGALFLGKYGFSMNCDALRVDDESLSSDITFTLVNKVGHTKFWALAEYIASEWTDQRITKELRIILLSLEDQKNDFWVSSKDLVVHFQKNIGFLWTYLFPKIRIGTFLTRQGFNSRYVQSEKEHYLQLPEHEIIEMNGKKRKI